MIAQSTESVAERFFAQVDSGRRGSSLFAHMGDVCYFAKDREGRIMAANEPLVLLLGRVSKSEIIGKTDFELVPSYLAEAYLKDDELVMGQGEVMSNKVELVTRNDLSVHWYTTTKVPLYGRNGEIIGLEGMTRPFAVASGVLGAYPEMYKVIDYVEANYARRISVGELAREAGLTLRTFERKFKSKFGISPSAYVKKVRINAACRELVQTNQTIAEIAANCGFCDQSYMTKEFARLMQATPQVYRETHVK
ncbi:AraC family transcriptional regulator [Pelagicoccus mobilis]|uniref:AraC family transcriptional regulator n=1 Tax=Pelagicoccus mobilis TaxID=415221 RepID=A0A934S329_9BACT|nr:AraC family transcriptional regulator [Pelagicoccus mobilis]MBK1878148.1 AraC family transcriptional regulator [Pelagicoccus mobilis]